MCGPPGGEEPCSGGPPALAILVMVLLAVFMLWVPAASTYYIREWRGCGAPRSARRSGACCCLCFPKQPELKSCLTLALALGVVISTLLVLATKACSEEAAVPCGGILPVVWLTMAVDIANLRVLTKRDRAAGTRVAAAASAAAAAPVPVVGAAMVGAAVGTHGKPVIVALSGHTVTTVPLAMAAQLPQAMVVAVGVAVAAPVVVAVAVPEQQATF